MLRLTNLNNVYKRRTLRALYAQTQAYPYATRLETTFVRTGGLLTASATSATAKAAIYPGMVAYRKYSTTDGGEVVTTNANAPNGTTGVTHAMGLFGNFVGGELDELFGQNEVGVWRGRGVFEVLSPAFDDAKDIAGNAATLGAAYIADVGDTSLHEEFLGSNADSRLAGDPLSPGPEGVPGAAKTNAANRAVARLLDRLSPTAIVIELLV